VAEFWVIDPMTGWSECTGDTDEENEPSIKLEEATAVMTVVSELYG